MTSARRILAVALFLACGAPYAQPADDDAVVVTALRNPVSKSYKKMMEGVALFEERRHLAPAAELRFRLLPRKRGTSLNDVELEIAGESTAIPLEVAEDRTFVLERDRKALEENARVMPNRRAGTMTWRVDVRTPGLSHDVRRLGDLRLECEVGMKSGLISQYPRGFYGWLVELFPRGPGKCYSANPRYLFFADRPLWKVTLVDGERREVLSVDLLYGGATRDPEWKDALEYCDCEVLMDRAYFVPLGDMTWSNDTRVELEYMDDAS